MSGATAYVGPRSDEILRAGSLCYVCAETVRGPHLTPLVFVWWGQRLWLTTARASVKSRTWALNNTVSGMVLHDGRALCFKGVVRTYDLLDPSSWVGAALYAPALARATAEFTRKNARFFAGYALDARQVPLAWTPPGRVFVEVQMKNSVVFDLASGEEAERAWIWEPRTGSRDVFRPDRGAEVEDPLDGIPEDVRAGVATPPATAGVPDAALAFGASYGTCVVPARWTISEGALFAAVDAGALALASSDRSDLVVAFAADHEAEWRASAMTGFMVRGTAEIFLARTLRSGKRALAARLAELGARGDEALLRISPRSIVWWKGWSGGTVRR